MKRGRVLSLNRFDKIVTAIDGSEGSLNACKATASIASKFKAAVTLIEVIPSGGFSLKKHGEEFKSKVEQDAKKHLARASSSFESQGVDVKMEILDSAGQVVRTFTSSTGNPSSLK